MPLNKILSVPNSLTKPIRTPEEYLSKKYSDSHLGHYRVQSEANLEKAKKRLEEHNNQMRIKIKGYRNELKDLDVLKKKRNVIRVLKLRED